MPRVKGKVLKAGVKDGKALCLIHLNRKIPRSGEYVTLKWGAQRSLPQNALYWTFLTWLIEEGGLKEQGHFIPEALHENLKQHFKEESTALLGKADFSEWMEKIDEFMQDFFGLNTTPFWEEYGSNHAIS